MDNCLTLKTKRMAAINHSSDLPQELTSVEYTHMLKKLNTQLFAKAKELSQSNAELERFAYVVSHDLQEPLRTITAFLRLLQQRYDGQFDEKGKQYIHLASDGAQRMKQIIEELLEFSKVGKVEDKRDRVDLQEMTNHITALFHQQITETEAKLDIAPLPVVLAFRAPMRQVFQNLIGNALKYQHPTTQPIVKVTCEDQGSYWKFAVSDNGIGIPKEQFEQVFVIFKRLHDPEQYPGTGVGLAVTKKIIEFVGGKIWVESEVGKGSTFHFTLPKK